MEIKDHGVESKRTLYYSCPRCGSPRDGESMFRGRTGSVRLHLMYEHGCKVTIQREEKGSWGLKNIQCRG